MAIFDVGIFDSGIFDLITPVELSSTINMYWNLYADITSYNYITSEIDVKYNLEGTLTTVSKVNDRVIYRPSTWGDTYYEPYIYRKTTQTLGIYDTGIFDTGIFDTGINSSQIYKKSDSTENQPYIYRYSSGA